MTPEPNDPLDRLNADLDRMARKLRRAFVVTQGVGCLALGITLYGLFRFGGLDHPFVSLYWAILSAANITNLLSSARSERAWRAREAAFEEVRRKWRR